MHCNHLPTPGLCEVFELGIDRPNEVELLFAPPAFELFFPNDGVADVIVAFKVEQALAPIFRSETFERALFMLHNSLIQIAGDANVKRACIAAENVDVATGHSKMLASSRFLAAGKDRGGSAQCGLLWLKSSEQHG
jgi:hypothetical protein